MAYTKGNHGPPYQYPHSEILTKGYEPMEREEPSNTIPTKSTQSHQKTKRVDEGMCSNVHEKKSADVCRSTRASQVSDCDCPRESAAATSCALNE